MAPTNAEKAAAEQKAAEETAAAEKAAAEQKAAEETAAAEKGDDPPSDLGTAEVSREIADAQAQGFIGTKVDQQPNSAHSLESGPLAPPVHETPQRPDIADLIKEG